MSTALVKYSYCLLRGWEAVRHLRDLEKSQWLPTREIQRIQLEKLKKLVRHAYENVPFYHRKFKEASIKPGDLRTLVDLQKLPIVTRKELKAHTPNGTVAVNYDVKTLKMGQTGGTTGKPFIYFKNRKTIDHEMAALCWFRSWYGSFGFKQAFFRLFPSHAPWSKEFRSFLIGWLICDRNLATLHKYAYWIKRFKPKVLEGSPVGFYVLANFLEKKGSGNIDLPIVLSTSETLFGFQRQAGESAFNCRVFNHYGSNEICSIAQECDEHTGLHINAEDRIVEFIKRGQLVSPGEKGEIVITDLENYSMPFIRYNIKDVGEPMDNLCSCGRGLPLIKEINGRVSGLLVSSDGSIISGDTFAQFVLFRGHKWTEQFQVIQPTKKELLIKIVKSPDWGPENLQFILEKIHEYLGEVEIKTEFVDSIPPPQSGKHRFIISEASQEVFGQS